MDEFKKKVFDEILEQFEIGELTFKGRGGVDVKVTSKKQALAMAFAMSNKAWKRHVQSLSGASLN